MAERRERLFDWSEEAIIWHKNAVAYGDYYAKLAAFVLNGLPEKARICDVGCGTGALLLQLAPHCREAVGIDIRPHVLEELKSSAAALGLKNVRTVPGDFAELEPFAERFDAMVFCQFGGVEKFYDQLRRWCAGKLFFIGNATSARGFSATGKAGREVYYKDDLAFLDSVGASYRSEYITLEFGQPFENREDAERFMRHYDGESTEREIGSYLDANLVKAEGDGFELYLPCLRPLVLLEIEL